MTDIHHDFDLAAESLHQNNGPKTEELDSGDYFHAPERHWLVRFSVVIFAFMRSQLTTLLLPNTVCKAIY